QLAGDRAEDPGATGVALVVDQDRRVLVEADVAAVGATELLGGPDDHRLDHVALLDGGVRDGGLDARDDHVTDAGGRLGRAAHDPDALDRPGAGVVGDLEAGLGLDHAGASSPEGAVSATSTVMASASPADAASAVSAAGSASALTRPGWAAAWMA